MSKTFRRGGIHPPENKFGRNNPIEAMTLPQVAVVPLSQHIGAPATPVVAKGDKVKVGQLIGQAAGFVSANIHSPFSGTVASVDLAPDGGGIRRPAVTIQVEGDEWEEGIDRSADLVEGCSLEPAEIIKRIEQAGIVGMGGATFPTHVKLSVPPGKKAEFLIINGAECEPYLTSDHRMMLERGREMVEGALILQKALSAGKVIVGIEANKPDAIAHLRQIVKDKPGIEVMPLKTKYPQGGEKQLIAAVTGREVPSGGLPIDVGAVVQNVATAVAVYEAVNKNKPLIERVVCVSGKALGEPRNLMVRIGTPVSQLLEFCGGIPGDTGKIISGGPMMGRAMVNPDAPVTKGTSGIVLMTGREAERKEQGVCIRCGKCISVCPMGLEPYMLYKLGRRNMFAEAEAFHAADCVECGSCSYTCPAALPLLDYIRLDKAEVMKIVRARKQ